MQTLYDWDRATRILAAMKPLWEPGQGSGYHGLTQGYLVGESSAVSPAKRSARSSGTKSQSRSALTSISARARNMTTAWRSSCRRPWRAPGDPGYLDLDPDSVRGIVRANGPLGGLGMGNEIGWRRAEIPAANGHGNAHAPR